MSRLRCCFALLSLLVVCHAQGNSYTLTECNPQKNFDIVENHETSMTCTGPVYWHHVHWNITGPATNGLETTVAKCGACTLNACGDVCSSSNPNYEISRNFQFTTLQFKNNVSANNGAVVKCSNLGKNLQASCNIHVIKAYKLDKCVNGEVEVIENRETTIRCSGLDASQNMYWKATNLNGFPINIAECGHCLASDSCPQCRKANSHFRVTRSREFSDLQIVYQVSQKDAWTIACSKKDDATQDQCRIRVKYYHLPRCQNGTLHIWETQPQAPILCEGLQNLDTMHWTITDNNGSTSEIAKCLAYHSKYRCSSTDADFSAWRNRTVSQLVMENYVRDKVVNKTLTCIRRDGRKRDSCRIRAVYPAEITKRSVTLNGWTVTATAVIDKVYDSDKDVVCLWNMTGPNSIEVIEIERPQFSRFLESSRVYYNGNCSLSISANVTEGVYHVTVTVLPAGSPVAVGNVTLKKPGTLLRLPSCPLYIAEGTSLDCQCRHPLSLEGSPPATVTWLKHDVSTVLPIDHDTSVLKLSHLRREQNGTTYTCRSVWGPNNEVTRATDYTLPVAYGPSSARVTSQAKVTEATQHMTLTCTAYDVYPSANFTWSVPCLTLTLTSPISTCTLAQETMRNATEVVCLAINTEFPVLNTRGVYAAAALNQPETPVDKADAPSAFIVGGSVAAVFVVVFIVVIVVIIVKRKNRTYERPRRRRGIPEHRYSDLHPDNNTAPQPLNTAPDTSQNTADNTANNAAHNAAHNAADDTETGRVYVNTRGDGASGGAVYYNDTSDTQTALSTDGQDAVYYNDTSDTRTAPSNNTQDAVYYNDTSDTHTVPSNNTQDAVYYNDTSDTRTAPSNNTQDAVYYNDTSDTHTAPSTDGQDADHYYSEVTDLPPVELNGPAALTREADPGMNMSLYEEIK